MTKRANIITREDRVRDPLRFTIRTENYLLIRKHSGTDKQVADHFDLPLAIVQLIRSKMPSRDEVNDAIDDNP